MIGHDDGHRVVIRLSATQISLGRECHRKYGFNYILKIRSPETPQQALGLAVEQDEVTPYLLEGRPFSDTPAGKIAAPSAEFLPPPKTVELKWLQHEFTIENSDGRFSFLGYKDLRLPSGHILPPLKDLPGTEGTPCVVDFKTTKHFKYRKTAKTLKTDVQANVYAFDELLANPSLEFVDMYWVTMWTNPDEPLADYSHYRAKKDDVFEQFSKIEETAEQLYQIRTAAPDVAEDHAAALAYVMSLEPNTNACDQYGGCPHRGIRCNPSPRQDRASIIESLKKEKKNMSNVQTALERLKAKRQALPTLEPPAAASVAASIEAAGGVEPFAGINPPEKDLPEDGAPATVTPVVANDPVPKRRGPGRPKKAAEPVEVVATIPADAAPVAVTSGPTPADAAITEFLLSASAFAKAMRKVSDYFQGAT